MDYLLHGDFVGWVNILYMPPETKFHSWEGHKSAQRASSMDFRRVLKLTKDAGYYQTNVMNLASGGETSSFEPETR